MLRNRTSSRISSRTNKIHTSSSRLQAATVHLKLDTDLLLQGRRVLLDIRRRRLVGPEGMGRRRLGCRVGARDRRRRDRRSSLADRREDGVRGRRRDRVSILGRDTRVEVGDIPDKDIMGVIRMVKMKIGWAFLVDF